jgi:hypothetical protein
MVKDSKTNEGKLRVKVLRDNRGEPIKDNNGYDKTDSTAFEQFKPFMVLEFIRGVSLNRVTVTIDGVMSVDINTIAARIDSLEFERAVNCGDKASPCFWVNTTADNGVRKGIIHGSYMTGGSVVIAEATDLSITEVKTISEDSSDQELHFSFKLTKAIPPQTKLHFTVSKPQPTSADAKRKTMDSVSFEYLVDYSPQAPAITSVKQEDSKLTVKGSNFFDPLVINLHPPTGDDVEVTPTSVSPNGDQLVLTIPDDAQPAGCWYVWVKVNGVSSNHSNHFVVKPKPTLDSATRNTTDHTIMVTGGDLIDTTGCGGPKLSFQLQKTGVAPKVVAFLLEPGNLLQAMLRLPPEANKGEGWTVHVFLDGKDIANIELK